MCPKFVNHQGHEVSRRQKPKKNPSWDFVSLVVDEFRNLAGHRPSGIVYSLLTIFRSDEGSMSLPGRLLSAWCILFAAGAFAQERPVQLPDAPEVQKPAVPAAAPGPSIPGVKTLAPERPRARLALLSQISSKISQWFFFHGQG